MTSGLLTYASIFLVYRHACSSLSLTSSFEGGVETWGGRMFALAVKASRGPWEEVKTSTQEEGMRFWFEEKRGGGEADFHNSMTV